MGTRHLFTLKHPKRVYAPLWKPLRPRQSVLLVNAQKKALRKKHSPFALRLRLRRLVCLAYGHLSARVFTRTAAHAARVRTSFGQSMIANLERRLEVVVFRAGFSRSIAHARQRIRHGYVTLNGCVITLPGTPMRDGDVLGWTAHRDKVPQVGPKPLHLEINYKVHKAVFLFSPQAIYFPTFIDLKDLSQLAP